MKRREFLVTSAFTGIALPTIGFSQTKPCPPPSLNVAGGTSSTTACVKGSAESDWVARSTAPGVVWAHDFRNAAEVNNFRLVGGIGTDPVGSTSTVKHVSSDGITGGCVEVAVPAGGTSVGGWCRPFSPITGASNGRGVNDPGAGGSITPLTWNPNNRNALGEWGAGYYAHKDYWNHPTRGPSKGFSFDGTDFYIQARIKMPASRFQSGQPDGKLMMILITGDGPQVGTGQPRTPNQEIVVKSNPSKLYQMYTNFGNRANSYLTGIQGASGGGAYQPGGAYNSTCVIGNTTTSTCWSWPADEYVTVLIHVIPGHDGGGGDSPTVAGNPNNDTGIEVWVARKGATAYTKIWDKKDYVFSFGENDPWPLGFNCIAFNAYMNDVKSTQAFYHRCAQMIFSKQFIACPQD
jgi:hypothetical protein